jgi:hypothetical protein
MTLLLALFGCGSDVGIAQNEICDGSKQPGEDTVDAPFDKDGDGYMDGNNPDCVLTYGLENLDCDDANPDIHPSASEIGCNGWDDDCDPETLDEDDLDEDNFGSCNDCDDLNPNVYPGNEETLCNAIDDDCNEDTLDAPDVDEDGWTVCDGDCEDLDDRINPDMEEVTCNDVDDDCSSATPDAEDYDGDGWSTCDGDCDDEESLAWPGYEEQCDDGIDNDCNGAVDEDCELDYTDTWFLDSSVSMSCAFGSVELSFGVVDITHSGSNLVIYGGGTKGQPGSTVGTLTGSAFETERSVPGSCTETYIFEGEFTNKDTFEGTFIAKYTGGTSNCWDCKTTSWDIIGTR